MTKVQAWERLHDPHYSSKLNMEEFYELMIEAGYTKEVAQKAATDRGWNRLDAGMVM